MMRTTKDMTTATDEALVTAAARGAEPAFTELHRRHAPLAWRLAVAITGEPELAARAVAEGTGTVFTALRAGRFQAQTHATSLAAATRNAALDLRRGGVATSPAVADDADALLVTAFASLPERWRSVLWLRDGEGLPPEQVAPIVELDAEAVDQLAVRARRGLRERYLRAQLASAGGRNCNRAISRLGALDDGTLGEKDVENLERHLRLCPACAERRTAVAGLGAALPALALPLADDLLERSSKAWTAALASSTHTGLSPRTEKILAGASAFAAAVGVLGATLFGTGGGDESTASPLAPLVADIETPRPIDLSALTLPLTTPDAITSTARRSLSPVAGAPSAAAGPQAVAGGEVAAPAAPAAPGGTGSTPAAEGPQGPGDVPVQVDLEDGVVVGPVTIDPTPSDSGKVLDVTSPAPAAPVVDPIQEAVNDVATPVLQAAEPATAPVAEAVKPVTDAVTSVAGNLGL